jgi:hypothetical protein
VVLRGQRGSVRASTLDELQTQLDQPWTDEEVARFNRKRDEQRQASRDKRRDRVGAEPKRGLRDRGRGQRPGRNERGARKDTGGGGAGGGGERRGGGGPRGRGGRPGGGKRRG